MAKKDALLTRCAGTGCPLKETCIRYMETIDEATVQHFAFAPYNGQKDACGFYLTPEIDLRNLINPQDGSERN